MEKVDVARSRELQNLRVIDDGQVKGLGRQAAQAEERAEECAVVPTVLSGNELSLDLPNRGPRRVCKGLGGG